MAKRGYRGKHPHNDAKVSKHSESTDKRNPKLQAEYDNLHSKQKYSFIRDHQGFFPQASAAIVCHTGIGDNSQLTMSAFDGNQYLIRLADRERPYPSSSPLFLPPRPTPPRPPPATLTGGGWAPRRWPRSWRSCRCRRHAEPPGINA